ncbi:MAG: ATP-binding protein [Anaerolineae bacterium]
MLSFTDYRLQQREYLLRIARAMTSELELRDVLRMVIEHAVTLLTGQAGLITLRRPDDTFGIVASYGIERQMLRRFAPLLQGMPSAAFEGDRPGRMHPQLQRWLAAIASSFDIPFGDSVAMPLTMAEEFIGVIFIFRGLEAQFTPMDRQLLADFADIAAIAVRNAQLFQQVLEERRQLKTLVTHTEEGVAILDPGGYIRLFNQALASMTGWPASQAIGRPVADVITVVDERANPVRAPNIPGDYRPDDDEPRRLEGWLIRRDATQGPYVGITLSPLYDNSGQLFSVVVNFQDVTRFKEAEDLKSTFVSVVSHELKTPLAIITGYAETLGREDAGWDTETIREGLAIIRDESARLNRLIEDLLDAARVEAGVLELRMSYIRLDDLAKSSVEALRPLERDHMFAVDFPPEFPTVPGDPERLRQVLRNLLNNAIKYSPVDSLIRISGHIEPDKIVVSVSDEGPGIPLDEQRYLFDRFTRGPTAQHTTSGAGLGLYLSKAIIEAHGGEIWVESAPGQGATFYFSLPKNSHTR